MKQSYILLRPFHNAESGFSPLFPCSVGKYQGRFTCKTFSHVTRLPHDYNTNQRHRAKLRVEVRVGLQVNKFTSVYASVHLSMINCVITLYCQVL